MENTYTMTTSQLEEFLKNCPRGTARAKVQSVEIERYLMLEGLNPTKVRVLKSEILFEKARQEDNDLKALGIWTASIRGKRSEAWEDKWHKLFAEHYDVTLGVNGGFTIDTAEKGIGFIDYFPKANKILIRKTNTWKKPGLRWLIKNLTDA